MEANLRFNGNIVIVTGDLQMSGTGTVQAVAFVETSSQKFKENIKTLDSQLDKVKIGRAHV